MSKGRTHTAVLQDAQASRPAPPADLAPAARAKWIELVASLPAATFGAADLPMLRRWCEAAAWRAKLAKQFDAMAAVDAAGRDGLKLQSAIGMIDVRLLSLERSMRLTAQAREDKRAGARRVGNGFAVAGADARRSAILSGGFAS
jgi:hypothetical protein